MTNNEKKNLIERDMIDSTRGKKQENKALFVSALFRFTSSVFVRTFYSFSTLAPLRTVRAALQFPLLHFGFSSSSPRYRFFL